MAPGCAAPAGVIGNGAFQRPLLTLAFHQAVITAPSGPIQNTSSCPSNRETEATLPVSAWPALVTGNGGFQKAWLTVISHQADPIAPSGPTQKTSRWLRDLATHKEAEARRFAGALTG